uniref:Secreted protein n=1 Tax=Ixodes scapularis TaxID=6945 RepID=A0A1S4LJA0_IXOSC
MLDDSVTEVTLVLCLCSFGKRSGGTGRRMNECLILEPSEMVVVSRTGDNGAICGRSTFLGVESRARPRSI